MYIFSKAVKGLLISGLIVSGTTLVKAQSSVASPAADSVSAVSKKQNNSSKVSGKVTDAASGKGVSGVSISLSGYSATISDDAGNFKISVPNYKVSLDVTAEGYQQKEVALLGKNKIEIVLYDETLPSVYETVVLPAGSVRQNHITNAIESVHTDDTWGRKSEAADSYLQGKVSGLYSVRRSGTAGIGANSYLRGFSSLYTTNRPLIVVDGMIYDNDEHGTSLLGGFSYNSLQDIELKDIESITVLKDASATQYGTRGANGVLLINTIRAKQQPTQIDFGAFGGFNSKTSNIPVLDAGNYRTYLSDLLKTSGLSDDAIRALPYMNDANSVVNGQPINPNYYRYHQSTNWQDKVFSSSANQNYYLKVTGGDNIAVYGLSLGYLKNQGGIDQTDLSRYQTRFNADLNLTKKLKGLANLSFTSNEQNVRDQGFDYKTNPMYLALVKSPFLSASEISDLGAVSPNSADVDIFNLSNPVAVMNKLQGVNKNYRFFGSVGASYMLSKSLTAQTLVGVSFDKVREKLFIPDKGVVGDTVRNKYAYNEAGSNVERLLGVFTDTRLSYHKTYRNVHSVNANLGFRFNANNSENDYGLGYNSGPDEFVNLSKNNDATLRTIAGSIGEWNWLNNYFSTDYGYLNKYFVSFNMAIDASSRFGSEAPNSLGIAGTRFAVLPAVSAAWLLSSEKFLSGIKAIESLKLRASYGLTGNDDIGNYTAKQYYVSQNILGTQGLIRGNIANPRLKWETVEKADIGIDASFFKERLSLSMDWFRHHNRDMLVYQPALTLAGFQYIINNDGSMTTSGLELGVNARLINKSALKWDMGVTLNHFKNRVNSLPVDAILSSFGQTAYITQKGGAANLFYGYKTNGIYTSNAEAAAEGKKYKSGSQEIAFAGGDVRFEDFNGDNIIDENDRTVIGNPNPDVTGAFNNAVSWKRWSFNAMFTFCVGNDIYNYTRSTIESMSDYNNQTAIVNRRWRVDGQVTDIPRAAFGDPAGNARFSDRWIEDGSYLRLRNLNIAYNYPIKNSALKYAKVYLSGNDLLTLTKYKGYDPEFSAANSVFGQGVDAGMEPIYKTVQLGVRIGL